MNCIKYRRSLIDIDWRRPDTVDKREGSESEAEWGEKWFGLWRWIMQLKHTINAIKITIKHATFATNGWQHCRLGNADGDVDADADVAVDCTKRQRWAERRCTRLSCLNKTGCVRVQKLWNEFCKRQNEEKVMKIQKSHIKENKKADRGTVEETGGQTSV